MHMSVFTGGGEGRAAEAAPRMVGELKCGGQDPSVYKCACVCVCVYKYIYTYKYFFLFATGAGVSLLERFTSDLYYSLYVLILNYAVNMLE